MAEEIVLVDDIEVDFLFDGNEAKQGKFGIKNRSICSSLLLLHQNIFLRSIAYYFIKVFSVDRHNFSSSIKLQVLNLRFYHSYTGINSVLSRLCS